MAPRRMLGAVAAGSALALLLASVPAVAETQPNDLCPPLNNDPMAKATPSNGLPAFDPDWLIGTDYNGDGFQKVIKIIQVCFCPPPDPFVPDAAGEPEGEAEVLDNGRNGPVFCCPPPDVIVYGAGEAAPVEGLEIMETICPCPPVLNGNTQGTVEASFNSGIIYDVTVYIFLCPVCDLENNDLEGTLENGNNNGVVKIIVVCPCPETGAPPPVAVVASVPTVEIIFDCPPECPENLSAEAEADGDIALDWDLPSTGPLPDSFNIYRAEEMGPKAFLDSVDGGTTQYTDTTSEPGVTYTYEVRSVFNGKESEDCPMVEITAIPFFGGPLLTAIAGVGAVAAVVAFRRRAA